MQLADEGRIDLDLSIADYLPRLLPEYVMRRLIAGRSILPAMSDGAADLGAYCFPTVPAATSDPNRTATCAFTRSGRTICLFRRRIILLQFGPRAGLGPDVMPRCSAACSTASASTSTTWRADFGRNLPTAGRSTARPNRMTNAARSALRDPLIRPSPILRASPPVSCARGTVAPVPGRNGSPAGRDHHRVAISDAAA